MKKVIKLLLAFMLMCPVYVNANDTTKDNFIIETENYSFSEQEFIQQHRLSLLSDSSDGETTSDTGLYKSQLTDKQLELYEVIEEANITRENNSATFTYYFTDENSDATTAGAIKDEYLNACKPAIVAYMFDHQEKFYWSDTNKSNYSLLTSKYSDGSYYAIQVILEYTVSSYYTDEIGAQADAVVDEAVASITGTTLYEKLQQINDWICEHDEYNYDALEASETSEEFYYAHSSLGCFIKNTGVCESYAKAFKIICNKLGITCLYITSSDHAFNYIKMEDGNWYMIDSTWNDPGNEYFLVSNNPYIDEHHAPSSDFVVPVTSASAYVYNPDTTHVHTPTGTPVITYAVDNDGVEIPEEIETVTLTCATCGETFEGIWQLDLDTTIEPTCTEAGEGVRTVYIWATGEACDNGENPYYTNSEDIVLPAIGHEYEETQVAETSTTRSYTLHKCSICGDEYKDNYGHYVSFKTASLVLSGLIGVNFGLEIREDALDQDGYMEFKVGNSTEIQRVDLDKDSINSKGRYIFTCKLTSIQMADEITATYYFGNSNVIYIYSAQEYADYLITHITNDDSLVELAKAIKNYGYYAEEYFSNLNNWTIGDKHAAMEKVSDVDTTVDLSAYKHTKIANNTGISASSFTLDLASTTIMKIYLDKGTYSGSDPVFKVNGNVVTATYDESKDRYCVVIDGIMASQLGDMYTISVDDEDVFKACALSYARIILNNADADDNYKNLMAALYEYYVATMNYRNK